MVACTTCDILKLGSNIINFVLFTLVPAIAVLLYLIAGFMILLGGASPGWIGTGQTIFKNTTWGLIVIFSAWMITNSVLKSIAGEGMFTKDWNKVVCTETVNKTPSPVQQQHYSCGSQGCVANPAGQHTEPTCGGKCAPVPTQPTTPVSGSQCLFSGVNLCEGKATECTAASCSQYTDEIERVANGAATVSVLKALMFAESTCRIVVSPDESSYGLMQLQPSTANMFKDRCGVKETIKTPWLMNPANAEKSICIGAAFINAIAAGICGPSVRNLYAGYNGGQSASGACGQSSDCAGKTSCDGSPVKRWECPYEDPEHTICNGGREIFEGYNQTRAGALKVMYCAANPGF